MDTFRQLSPGLSSAAVDKMVERRLAIRDAEARTCSLSEFAEAKGVHRSTIWRWARKLAIANSLLDDRHTRSGRKSIIDRRVLGYSLCYLEAYPKTNITDLALKANEIAMSEGWNRTSYNQLRKAISRLPLDMVVSIRDGFKEMFHSLAATILRIQEAVGILCQMDSTELDVWMLDVVTGQLVKGWITTIIECYSRCIIAIVLQLTEPTAKDVLSLIRQAIFPKNRDDWPFYCLMKELQRDNAQCFRAQEVKEALLRLDIVYSDGPGDVPNRDGKQERFFRTFKEQFLTHLLGYTGQANGLAKASRAAIPWPLMEKLTQDFLLKYHTRFHRGIGCTPWERWMEGLPHARGLVYDPSMVRDALKTRRCVSVRRGNVTLPGLGVFSSPTLVGLSGKIIEVRHDDAVDSVDAYHNGEFLDHLRSWNNDSALALDIAKARLDRLKELKKFRQELRRLMKTAPPIISPATRIATRNGRQNNGPSETKVQESNIIIGPSIPALPPFEE